LGRFFAGSLAQTEDGAFAFVVPIFQVLNAMLVLDLEVLLVGFGEFFGSNSFHVSVNIHIEWHLTVPPF
jgi:hypothetical protein